MAGVVQIGGRSGMISEGKGGYGNRGREFCFVQVCSGYVSAVCVCDICQSVGEGAL